MVIFLHPPLFSIQGLKKKKTPPLKDCIKRAGQIFLQTLRILLSETFLNENISSKKYLYNRCHLPLYFVQKSHGLQCHFNGLAAILKKITFRKWDFWRLFICDKTHVVLPKSVKKPFVAIFLGSNHIFPHLYLKVRNRKRNLRDQSWYRCMEIGEKEIKEIKSPQCSPD